MLCQFIFNAFVNIALNSCKEFYNTKVQLNTSFKIKLL